MEAQKTSPSHVTRGIVVPAELVRMFKEEVRFVPVIRSGMIMIPEGMLKELDVQKLNQQGFTAVLVRTADIESAM